jgi:galactose mutarotase-like enzyme
MREALLLCQKAQAPAVVAGNDATNLFPADPFFCIEAGQLPDGRNNPLPGTSRGAHGLDQ